MHAPAVSPLAASVVLCPGVDNPTDASALLETSASVTPASHAQTVTLTTAPESEEAEAAAYEQAVTPTATLMADCSALASPIALCGLTSVQSAASIATLGAKAPLGRCGVGRCCVGPDQSFNVSAVCVVPPNLGTCVQLSRRSCCVR